MTAIQCQPQRTIRFYGPLAKALGRRSFSAIGLNSASEVMRCLLSNFPQLGSHMRGRHYRVVMNGRAISGEELNDPVGIGHEIHIIPAICGAGGGNPLTTILTGVALIGAGLLFPFASSFLTPLGIGLVLQGVAEMISPTPNDTPESTDPSNRSYNFSGLQQTSRAGVPVPLVYGEIVTGSVVLSVNIERDDEKLGAGDGKGIFEPGPGDPSPFYYELFPGAVWSYIGDCYYEPNGGCPAHAAPGGTYRRENTDGSVLYGKFQIATVPELSGWVGDSGCLNATFRGVNLTYTVTKDSAGNEVNNSQLWQIAVNNLFGMKPSGYRVWRVPTTSTLIQYPDAPTTLIASSILSGMPSDYKLPDPAGGLPDS